MGDDDDVNNDHGEEDPSQNSLLKTAWATSSRGTQIIARFKLVRGIWTVLRKIPALSMKADNPSSIEQQRKDAARRQQVRDHFSRKNPPPAFPGVSGPPGLVVPPPQGEMPQVGEKKIYPPVPAKAPSERHAYFEPPPARSAPPSYRPPSNFPFRAESVLSSAQVPSQGTPRRERYEFPFQNESVSSAPALSQTPRVRNPPVLRTYSVDSSLSLPNGASTTTEERGLESIPSTYRKKPNFGVYQGDTLRHLKYRRRTLNNFLRPRRAGTTTALDNDFAEVEMGLAQRAAERQEEEDLARMRDLLDNKSNERRSEYYKKFTPSVRDNLSNLRRAEESSRAHSAHYRWMTDLGPNGMIAQRRRLRAEEEAEDAGVEDEPVVQDTYRGVPAAPEDPTADEYWVRALMQKEAAIRHMIDEGPQYDEVQPWYEEVFIPTYGNIPIRSETYREAFANFVEERNARLYEALDNLPDTVADERRQQNEINIESGYRSPWQLADDEQLYEDALETFPDAPIAQPPPIVQPTAPPAALSNRSRSLHPATAPPPNRARSRSLPHENLHDDYQHLYRQRPDSFGSVTTRDDSFQPPPRPAEPYNNNNNYRDRPDSFGSVTTSGNSFQPPPAPAVPQLPPQNSVVVIQQPAQPQQQLQQQQQLQNLQNQRDSARRENRVSPPQSSAAVTHGQRELRHHGRRPPTAGVWEPPERNETTGVAIPHLGEREPENTNEDRLDIGPEVQQEQLEWDNADLEDTPNDIDDEEDSSL